MYKPFVLVLGLDFKSPFAVALFPTAEPQKAHVRNWNRDLQGTWGLPDPAAAQSVRHKH